MKNSNPAKRVSNGKWRPYPAYKDSGVEWLGRIPARWKLKPLKRLFRVVNGSTPKSGEPDYWDGDIPWVTPDDLGQLSMPELLRSARYITRKGYESCGTTLVPEGSLVLSTRAPIGHLAIAGVPLCTNQGCRSLAFRKRQSGRYYYYQLLAARPELESLGDGSTFKELAGDSLESAFLLEPPPGEQLAIAAFLDRETARIDALVAKKERLIELLQEKRAALITQAVTKGLDPTMPMKDSGVEWLGKIPAHWDVAPTWTRYSVQLGKMLDTGRISGEHLAPYLRNVDVQWDSVNVLGLPEMGFTPSDRERFTLRSGDLLVCEGGEVGRAAIWRGELSECYYQKAIHRVRALHPFDDHRFFFYVLYAAAKGEVFVAYSNPNTIDHLTAEKLRRHRFPFPPHEEQRAIAAFLDRETAEIDALIAKVGKGIEKLKEYRTALISAAVTGKIDVREAV